METDRYKIKVNTFSSELEAPLDRNLRSFITIEADIYDVGTPDNHDGTCDTVYRAKLVGSTIIRQEGQKTIIKGKSKRTNSQRLRAAIWAINSDEVFYDVIMNKIIANIEEVIEFLKNK